MFLRILFLTVISLQISGCVATPRLFSKVVDDYEPPVKKQAQEPQTEQEKPKRELSEQAKEEIRKQVREEIRLQNAAMTNATTTTAPVKK